MRPRNLCLAILLVSLLASLAGATVQTDLTSAEAQKQVVFLLVIDENTTGIEQARALIQTTMTQLENAISIDLNRSDSQNADLIAKFRLAGAPLPLILVSAPNGVLAGGMPAGQATTKKLLAMVPSPKKAEVLKALQEGKAVFINASKKNMAAQSGTLASCAAACGQLNDQGVTIEIDMDDPQEMEFLTQLEVDRSAKEPVTLVLNAQGQITETYSGPIDVANLVTAATKKAGGCCPPTAQGGGGSCDTKK